MAWKMCRPPPLPKEATQKTPPPHTDQKIVAHTSCLVKGSLRSLVANMLEMLIWTKIRICLNIL